MAPISSGTLQNTPLRRAFRRQVAKEPLDHVQPRSACRCEVHVKSRMLGKPSLDRWRFVGCVVIHDEVEFLVLGRFLVDQLQELQPLLVTMARHTGTDYRTVERIERRK